MVVAAKAGRITGEEVYRSLFGFGSEDELYAASI